MSIQTTQTITEEAAKERIIMMVALAVLKNYKKIKEESFEPDLRVENYIEEMAKTNVSSIDNWTTEMLEDVIDKPFFRLSMFDNYCVSSLLIGE